MCSKERRVVHLLYENINFNFMFQVAANVGYQRGADKKWITVFNALMIALNEDGVILKWKLTKSQGFEELRHMFQEYQARLNCQGRQLRGVIIDNCCSWKKKIVSVFRHLGNDDVKLDLFHAVTRVTNKISKRWPKRALFSRLLAQVFRAPGDIKNARTKITPSIKVMTKQFDRFQREWRTSTTRDSPLKIPKVKKEMTKLRMHITRGCLSGIPAGLGTNRNERIHRKMRKIIGTTKLGVKLMYAKMSNLFHEHNLNKLGNGYIEYNNTKESINVDENFGLPRYTSRDVMQNSAYLSQANVCDILRTLEDMFICETDENDHVHYTSQTKDNSSRYVSWTKDALKLWLLDNSTSVFNNKPIECLMDLLSSNFEPTLKGDISNHMDDMDNAIEDEALKNQADLWGMSIVQSPKDGDCFFHSVAFQIEQNLQEYGKEFADRMTELGIYEGQPRRQMVAVLRRLLVREWTGDNCVMYMNFLRNSDDFYELAESFLSEGVFENAMGDIMALGMANVMGFPIVILSSILGIPVVPIIPTTGEINYTPIYLAFTQQGGGHYDSLITEMDDVQGNVLLNSDGLSKSEICRCGVNDKKSGILKCTRMKKSDIHVHGAKNRRVKCPCFLKGRKCAPACRCVNCGNKDNTTVDLKHTRKRKRTSHVKERIGESNADKWIAKRVDTNIEITSTQLNKVEVYLIITIIKSHVLHNKIMTKIDLKRIYDDVADLLAGVLVHSPVGKLAEKAFYLALTNITIVKKWFEKLQKKL